MKVIKKDLELYPQEVKDNPLFAHCIGEKGIPRWQPSIHIMHTDGLKTVLEAHGETLEIIEYVEPDITK